MLQEGVGGRGGGIRGKLFDESGERMHPTKCRSKRKLLCKNYIGTAVIKREKECKSVKGSKPD